MVLFFGFGVFGLGVGVLNKYKIVFIIIVKFLNYFVVWKFGNDYKSCFVFIWSISIWFKCIKIRG